MATIRVNKTKNYTIMSNYHFKEKNMSLKAKGLLSLMLSLPDNWNYSIAGLVGICKENETAIKSTLNELREFGYLKITKLMPNESRSGRIEYIYDIYEFSKQEGKKQELENLPLEIQHIEIQGQLNTKELNTKELRTDVYNRKNIKKEIPNDLYENEFGDLWKEYPNKQGKVKAFEYYKKSRKKGTTFEEVKLGLDRYNQYCKKVEWYSPKNGSTWFNQECWKDEYIIPVKEEKKKSKYDWTMDDLINSEEYNEIERYARDNGLY